MKIFKLTARISQLTLGVAGSVVLAGTLLAQPVTEVTVKATRESKIVVGRAPTGAAIEEISLMRRVSYADLDLSTKSGADALEKRVNDAAKGACDELDKNYPLTEKSAPDCTKAAIKDAMVDVRAVVAAAAKRP